MATKKKPSRAPVTTTSVPLPADTEVLKDADAMKASTVLTAVADTRSAIEGVLSQLSDLTLAQIRTYEELKRAIQLKQEEMSDLHSKESVLTEIDVLKASMEETRLKWQAEREEEVRNRKASLTSWEFETDQHQKAVAAQLADQARDTARKESERVYALEQNWKQREAALMAQENELKTLREAVMTFDTRVKSEADKQVAMATNSLKKDYEHRMALDKLTVQSDLSRAQDKIVALTQTLETKTKEITALQAMLLEAQERSAKTVQSALDSASGRRALEEVRETLTSQQTPNRK